MLFGGGIFTVSTAAEIVPVGGTAVDIGLKFVGATAITHGVGNIQSGFSDLKALFSGESVEIGSNNLVKKGYTDIGALIADEKGEEIAENIYYINDIGISIAGIAQSSIKIMNPNYGGTYGRMINGIGPSGSLTNIKTAPNGFHTITNTGNYGNKALQSGKVGSLIINTLNDINSMNGSRLGIDFENSL